HRLVSGKSGSKSQSRAPAHANVPMFRKLAHAAPKFCVGCGVPVGLLARGPFRVDCRSGSIMSPNLRICKFMAELVSVYANEGEGSAQEGFLGLVRGCGAANRALCRP